MVIVLKSEHLALDLQAFQHKNHQEACTASAGRSLL